MYWGEKILYSFYFNTMNKDYKLYAYKKLNASPPCLECTHEQTSTENEHSGLDPCDHPR
jgi:hypothetical protein